MFPCLCNLPIKVSVLTIAYNQADYIRECLDGILAQQTDFPIEIIIHDDASTDGTAEIIKEYQRRYPEVVKPIFETENQYSKGLFGAIRFCFPHAQGEYIAICEGDDCWIDQSKLRRQAEFLNAHPDYTMAFHNAIAHWEDGSREDMPYSDYADGDYSFDLPMIPSASMLVRRSVIEHPLFSKAYSLEGLRYEDVALWTVAMTLGKAWGMKEQMSVYRRHEGAVTHDFWRNAREVEEVGRHKLWLAKTIGSPASLYLKEDAARALVNAAYLKAKSGIYADAFSALGRALRADSLTAAREMITALWRRLARRESEKRTKGCLYPSCR